MRLGQAHDAEAGAEALLGMAALAQDHLDQRRGVRPDLRRPALQSLGRPFGVAPMAGRHVVGDGGVLAVGRGPGVGGDALAMMEDLDRPGGEPDPDLLAQQAVRGRVVMLGRPRRGSRARRCTASIPRRRRARRAKAAAPPARSARTGPGGWRRDAGSPGRSGDRGGRGSRRSVSASEKNRWLRSRATIQRWAIWTATSTFALSRGLRGRAGTTAVP